MLQQCARCKERLSEESFHSSYWGRKGTYCRLCVKSYNQERSKRLWKEHKESPDYTPKKVGRKPDPTYPLRKAIDRAYRLERMALRQEIKDVKATLPSIEIKWEFYTRAKALGQNPDEIWAIYTSHDGTCMICGEHEDNLPKRLHIDHCHETGRFRGFLCGLCNTGLGALGDNLAGLQRAVQYLTW